MGSHNFNQNLTSEMKESYSSLAIGMVPFLALVPPWKPVNVDEEILGLSSIGLQHSSIYQNRREPILMSPSDQQEGNDVQLSLQVFQKGMRDTSLDNKVTLQEWSDFDVKESPRDAVSENTSTDNLVTLHEWNVDDSVIMDERKVPPGTINIKGIRQKESLDWKGINIVDASQDQDHHATTEPVYNRKTLPNEMRHSQLGGSKEMIKETQIYGENESRRFDLEEDLASMRDDKNNDATMRRTWYTIN